MASASKPETLIIGGGIAGLTLALALHRHGLPCTVYEAVPEVHEIGVGITILPHAMAAFADLGLEAELESLGIENRDSRFFNRFGQLIYSEDRGRHAGYAHPEISLHRGRLHMALLTAARDRLGADRIVTDRRCVGVRQEGDRVFARLVRTSSGFDEGEAAGDLLVACDGVNSAVRRQFCPGDAVVFTGINMWRGVTVMDPILGGRTYMRIGSIRTGKMVVYPIAESGDGGGRQLVNWVAEIETGQTGQANDWNTMGQVEDFIHLYESWVFDWLDVPAMIRNAARIFEYPMVDKEPLERWTFGRATLMGDAAHPMYPRGSNGAAQAVIDARTLAECLAGEADPDAALQAYEAARREVTGRIVRTNRTQPPDFINIKVEDLVGDRPFDNLDDYISQDELRALSESYKAVAGFSLTAGKTTL